MVRYEFFFGETTFFSAKRLTRIFRRNDFRRNDWDSSKTILTLSKNKLRVANGRWQRATEGSREAEPQALRWKYVIIFYDAKNT